jgi:glycosyltransferase involved in cell wall biosynthesis
MPKYSPADLEKDTRKGRVMQVATAVTTVVCDASKSGAGMASVALTVHKLLQGRLGADIVVGLAPERPVSNLHVVGAKGLGFRGLSRNSMRDVVHIHGLWTPFEWRAYREGRARGARVVISPHGSLEPWAIRHKRLKKLAAWVLYQKRILQQADLLVASSDLERDNFRELGLTAPIAVIPVGVDVSDRPEDLSESNGSDRKRIVLFLARLSPKKGILDLLEAWSGMTDRRGYELHIHGYGSASYRRYLENRISALKLEHHVKLCGPLYGEEKWRKLQQSSIYVLPSYSENFGITIAEALLSGLPVITSKATPWGELPSRGLGWIVDNEVDQLRDALHLAVSTEEGRFRAIRNDAHEYAQKYLWFPIADRYVDAYDWVTAPGATRPDWIATAT